MKKKNLKKFKLNKTNVSSVTNYVKGGAQNTTTGTLTIATIEITTKLVTFLCRESLRNINCPG